MNLLLKNQPNNIMKKELLITYTEEDGKGSIDMVIPGEHSNVTVREAARILCGGLMMLIKGAGKQDHILMQESVDFLNEQFMEPGNNEFLTNGSMNF